MIYICWLSFSVTHFIYLFIIIIIINESVADFAKPKIYSDEQ